MAKNDIESKVIQIVADILEIPASDLTLKTNLISDLSAESLDLVDLVTTLEDEYHITVSDEDIKNIQTISDIVDYIASQR